MRVLTLVNAAKESQDFLHVFVIVVAKLKFERRAKTIADQSADKSPFIMLQKIGHGPSHAKQTKFTKLQAD